jgi:hypothetical protein
MARWLPFVLALLVAGNAIAAPPLEASSEPGASAEEASAREALPGEDSSGLEESNAALLRRHAEIWGLMGLSAGAQEELNDTVVTLNTGIYKNQSEQPEIFKQAMAPTRSDRPLTYQSFVSSHKRRFALLKISGPVQAELLAALDFTWKALHDPTVPEEKRQEAEKIRALMKSIGGPPPCCDDSIFERSGMTTREP